MDQMFPLLSGRNLIHGDFSCSDSCKKSHLGQRELKKKKTEEENPVSVVNKCSRMTFKASTAERKREFSRYQQSLWWEKQTTNQWRLEEATPCRHWQLISGKLLCCCCWLNRLIVRGAPALLSQSAVIHSDQPQPHRGRLHTHGNTSSNQINAEQLMKRSLRFIDQGYDALIWIIYWSGCVNSL